MGDWWHEMLHYRGRLISLSVEGGTPEGGARVVKGKPLNLRGDRGDRGSRDYERLINLFYKRKRKPR